MGLTVKIRPLRGSGKPCDALIAKGRLDEALDLCRRALRQSPDDADLLRDLADVLVLKRRYRQALPVYRAAARKSPADRGIHELLCGAHVALGEVEKGRRILRAFFRDHPLESWDGAKAFGPTILRLAGVDGTFCRLEEKPNRRPGAHYRGGHFLTTHLLPKGRHRVLNWTIALGNINRRADVPAHDLMLNTIAEADTERRSLRALAEYRKRHPGVPIVNDPERVLQTGRDANAARLNAIPGVLFPRTARFSRNGAAPKAAAARVAALGFSYPVIVRETGTHTGRTVALIRDEAGLAGYFAKAARSQDNDQDEFYVTQFIDQRFAGPDGKRYFNKKRVFCIDGRLYPVVSHVDRVWNVHGHNRLTVMRQAPWMQEQEQRYLADPARAIGDKNYRILEGLAGPVGLDFFGVDYTVRPDGTLLIFELNAAMRHSHDHARNFPYLRPHMERISQAFAAMLERKLKG